MTENESPQAVVMALVREVAAELHPTRTLPPDAGPDHLLDHDFALDSLGRLELAGRIEDAFQITLTEARIANAETPRDLIAAVAGASVREGQAPGPLSPGPAPAVAGGEAGQVTLPLGAQTLTEMLDNHAMESPERVHIQLYDDECEAGGAGVTLTYGQLRDGARRVAAGLVNAGINPGDAVALMLPTGEDYFLAFFGILYAGGVPVPIYPPARISLISDHIRRHFGILGNCRARALIISADAREVATLLKGGVETIRTVATVADLATDGEIPPLPANAPGDITFIQFTSGSTGQPKGVVLSHDNLLANVRTMGRALRATPDDVFVSWLSLYHDMGLIGAWFGSLYHGVKLVIMSPLRFLARPERWLHAVHRFGGTITASPNFGMELCLKRIGDEKLDGLDLSSLRALCNGAEPISPVTIERFMERFAAHGFRRAAMMPVYGLAECSVGLTFPPLDRGPRIDRIDRDALAQKAEARVAAEGDEAALAVVGCGLALPGHHVRIVDAMGNELPERHEGRLQFLGPSATSGYLRNPEATAALMDGIWLNSGDMAYMADGEVFITGRAKDMIIIAGRNIYPQELEDAVGEIEGVRGGNVAVFASPDPAGGTERLVVLAETRRFDETTQARITREIEALAMDLTAHPPDAVVLSRPNTVLKTSSGKIRRAACREAYERGWLEKRHAAPWLQVLRLTLLTTIPMARRGLSAMTTALYAAYVWAVAGIIGLTFWPLIAVAPRPARWPIARGACRLMLGLSGISLSVSGRERLPDPKAPVVYVANHASFIDGFALSLAIGRPISFVAKRELLSHWAPRILLRRLGSLFVERFDREQGMADAERLVDATREGKALAFFPEGTFINRPGILPFQMGAFHAAAEAGVPVVPMAIRGTRSILVGDGWFPRPGRIRVTIGEVVAANEETANAWQRALTLRDGARAYILAHAGEPDMGTERTAPLGHVPERD